MEQIENKTDIDVQENGLISLNNILTIDDDGSAADLYGSNRFSNKQIQKRISEMRGIDKAVYEYLTENKRLPEMLLHQACMEMVTSGKNFIDLMLNHGHIKQDKLVELSLKVDPSELASKELIEPSVPFHIFKETRSMLHAVTDSTVYVSTLGSEYLVKIALKNFFPAQDFFFVPAKPKNILNYLEQVEKYGKQQGTLLEVVIRQCIREKASDIHVYPNREGYNIKKRVMGQLYVERVGALDEYFTLITKGKLEAGLDPANKRLPQSGQFSIDFNGRRIDLRIETSPVIGNKESMVIRILDPENNQVHFDDLGITEYETVKKAMQSPNGIFLICGVTGSGKTTTATSALRWVMDRFSTAINTIEDPVENELSDVKQTQVDHKSGLTFAKALRSILRQDPDVVVVGEIRDEETGQVAFQAAETGHFLMGTIHVKDIRGVARRLINYLNVDRERIISQLRGALVQSLIRTVCQSCKGEGCNACSDRGYDGRTVVSEAVFLRESEDVERMLDTSEKRWWTTIAEDAYNKYRKGITDRREMLRTLGPDFEAIEEKDAHKQAGKVLSGEISVDDFVQMFPAHRHLIEQHIV